MKNFFKKIYSILFNKTISKQTDFRYKIESNQVDKYLSVKQDFNDYIVKIFSQFKDGNVYIEDLKYLQQLILKLENELFHNYENNNNNMLTEIEKLKSIVNSINNPQDTENPTAPTNLVASGTTETATTLNWTASTDNKAVTGYEIYQDSVLITTVPNNTYQVTGLTENTSYAFYVIAKDDAGNSSIQSNTVNITTEEVVVEPVKAFPSVKGGGTNVTGGRGGIIVRVTNLNDSGSGSLRSALMMTVPRIIIFNVSGNIVLQSEIELILNNSNFTVAGQTAPEGGITFSNNFIRLGGGYNRPENEPCNNVIIRYLRFRNGRYTGAVDVAEHNGILSTGCSGLVIDHSSFSFCDDQAISMGGNYGNLENITIQNCIFSENATNVILGLNPAFPTGNITMIDNAFIDTNQRTPNIGGTGQYDVINNFYFNWVQRLININGGSPEVNYIGNYMQQGTFTTNGSGNKYQTGTASIYTANNYHNILYTTPQLDDRDIWQEFFSNGVVSSSRFTTTIHPILENVVPQGALGIKTSVLANVGSNKYLDNNGDVAIYQDSYDINKISNAQNNISSDPGNKTWVQPTLPNNTRPVNYSTLNDGIEDSWRTANMPNGASATALSPSGYMWIEKYINQVDI